MTSKAESGERLKVPPGIVAEMFMRVPPEGTAWPLAARLEWLRAMESIFDMIYGPSERIEIDTSEVLIAVGDKVSGAGLDGSTIVGITSSAEPTDEAMAGAEGVASGSGDAKTTEAPEETRMGGERSSSAETPKKKPVRPSDMPSNLQVCTEAIKALGNRASSTQIREWVRSTYWAEIPMSWTEVLWNFVTDGKLARDGINFVLPPETKDLVAPKPKARNPGIVMAPKPAARPTLPAPKPAGIKFDHDGKSTVLPDTRSFVIASKLRAAMGKGHIAEAFLAEQVIGSNTEAHRDSIKLACKAMGDALAEVGLVIEFYPGFGLIMKEVP